jgi:hypothetical protein
MQTPRFSGRLLLVRAKRQMQARAAAGAAGDVVMQTSQHNTMTYNTVAGNVMSSPPHTAMNAPNNTMLPPNNTTMVAPQQNVMVANNNTMVVQQNIMVASQSAMMAAAPQGVMMAPNNIVRSQMLVGGVMSQQQQQQQQQQQLAWQQQVGVAGRMQMVYQTDNSGVRPATQFNAANQGQMLQLMQQQQQQQRQQAPQSGGAQMMLGQQTMQAQVGLVRQQVSRPPAAMAGVQARPGVTQQFMNVSVAPQRMVGIMRAPGDHGLHLRIPAPGGLVPGAEEVTPLTPQDQLQRFIDQL